MDGTFWTAPKHFFQLFTIHGTVGGKSMPFIYAFMGDKREESYRAVFRKLRERVFQLLPDFNVQARWTHMMSDFENGSIAAFRDIFPEVKVVGYHFHYCQAKYRQISTKLGQRTLYDKKGKFFRFSRHLMAMAFFPESQIIHALDDLQETLSSAGEIDCRALIQYYTNTWLNGFGRETFCVSGLADRSNYKIEG